MRAVRALVQNRASLFGDVRYVFLLSHMRAYTSLLGHILGSHPEVSGYFEQHRAYAGVRDLYLMRLTIAEALGYRFSGRYAFDKLLHEQTPVAPGVLRRDDVLTIFMLRNPTQTLPSILSLLSRFSAERATDYYCTRLGSLVRAAQHAKHMLYVDGEALVDTPAPTLERIARYLGLSRPLGVQYDTFKYTGLLHYGDPSPAIRHGSILPLHDRPGHADVRIEPALMERAEQAYALGRGQLSALCREPRIPA